MELKDFVENTIMQITEGISNTNQKSDEKLVIGNSWRDITFDLMIQEEDASNKTTDKEKDGNVKVLKVIDVGINSSEKELLSNKNITSNRVKFSIPVVYR